MRFDRRLILTIPFLSLEKILRRSLIYRNKHAIRLLAYQILLSALDILYDDPVHKGFLPLLQDAINIQPFLSLSPLVPQTSTGTNSTLCT